MIDSAMLARLIEHTGSYSYLNNNSFLPLAKAIWNEAQKEEREACARAYKEMSSASQPK